MSGSIGRSRDPETRQRITLRAHSRERGMRMRIRLRLIPVGRGIRIRCKTAPGGAGDGLRFSRDTSSIDVDNKSSDGVSADARSLRASFQICVPGGNGFSRQRVPALPRHRAARPTDLPCFGTLALTLLRRANIYAGRDAAPEGQSRLGTRSDACGSSARKSFPISSTRFR